MSGDNGSERTLLDFLKNVPVSLPEKSVHVSEWGRNVTIRALTAGEKDEIDAAGIEFDRKGKPKVNRDRHYAVAIVSRSIVENGQKILADFRGEQLLMQQPNKVLRKLYAVANELSGLEDVDPEELEKNFEAAPAAASSSSSRSRSAGQSQSSAPPSANVN